MAQTKAPRGGELPVDAGLTAKSKVTDVDAARPVAADGVDTKKDTDRDDYDTGKDLTPELLAKVVPGVKDAAALVKPEGKADTGGSTGTPVVPAGGSTGTTTPAA